MIAGEQVEQGGEVCGGLFGFDIPFSIKKSSKQQAREAEEGTRSQKEKRDKTKEVWAVNPGSPRFLQRHVARRTSYAAYSFSMPAVSVQQRIIPSGLVCSGQWPAKPMTKA